MNPQAKVFDMLSMRKNITDTGKKTVRDILVNEKLHQRNFYAA
jgi:hypothetical protein